MKHEKAIVLMKDNYHSQSTYCARFDIRIIPWHFPWNKNCMMRSIAWPTTQWHSIFLSITKDFTGANQTESRQYPNCALCFVSNIIHLLCPGPWDLYKLFGTCNEVELFSLRNYQALTDFKQKKKSLSKVKTTRLMHWVCQSVYLSCLINCTACTTKNINFLKLWPKRCLKISKQFFCQKRK